MNRRLEFKRKMAAYGKILKEDHDCDWVYILQLLKYKLERTRRCLNSGWSEPKRKKRLNKQIQTVENLLNRVIEDRYFDQISKNFRKLYGPLRMVTEKPLPDRPGVPVSFRFKRENERNSKRIHKEFLRLGKKADQMLQKDLENAFKIMPRYIREWWD